MNTIIKLGLVALTLTAGCASVPRTSAMQNAAIDARTTPQPCIGRMTCNGESFLREPARVASAATIGGGQTMRSRDRRFANAGR